MSQESVKDDKDPFRRRYPEWPWVRLGCQEPDIEDSLFLPGPETGEDLPKLIRHGRVYQSLIEADEPETKIILVDEFKFSFRTRASGQHLDESRDLTSAWTITNTSAGLDNISFVHRDAQGSTVSEDGEVVNRYLDHLFSVLESLPVGRDDDGNGDQLKPWEPNAQYILRSTQKVPTCESVLSRTSNMQILPERPNNGKNGQYPTYSQFETVFNIYDGVIIMTDFHPRWPVAQNNTDPPPRPRCATWADVTFLQRTTFHQAVRPTNSPRAFLDLDFDPILLSDLETKRKFKETCIAGRAPSPHRQGLPFYATITLKCRDDMKGFLNYIISYGNVISDGVMPKIPACLKSRHKNELLSQFGPTWGSHETFKCGTWQFYTLLGSEPGKSVAMFLARHKRSDLLDHLMVKSVTVFATDTTRTGHGRDGVIPDQEVIVKWPVLIWEIVRFDQVLVDQARILDARFLRSNWEHRLDSNGNPKFPSENNPHLAKDYITEKPRILLDHSDLRSAEETSGNMVFK